MGPLFAHLRHRWINYSLSSVRKGVLPCRCITSEVVRQTFLDFFVKKHKHEFVASSSVLPQASDSSILFTTAGMNQFKPIFLESVDPGHKFSNIKRAANSQKCIRVGGKHNDLNNVGEDCYHHTFFEMLGNWSFGDYFKAEACEMAWELLTGIYALSPKRLFVTYFGGDVRMPALQPDLECRDIWLKIGVDPKRVIPFGCDANFWDMGDTGPCGPCTEIHYDHVGERDVADRVNVGYPDVTEIWNLVFMQFNRISGGSLEKLPRQHVDTGMGLERLTAVLQGKTSNYDTDLFQPLFNTIQKETGVRNYLGKFGEEDDDGIDTAYRVIADHSRMVLVSLCDGLLPDEYDAGQWLRKVMRRAMLKSKVTMKSPPGLMTTLFKDVTYSLQNVFPELLMNMHKAMDIVNNEEERFLKLLYKGTKYFDDIISKSKGSLIFRGEWMWDLYFIHGIPEEYIVYLAKCKGVQLDFTYFYKMMHKEKDKSKRLFSISKQQNLHFDDNAIKCLKTQGISPTNVEDVHKYEGHGYNVLPLNAQIKAIWCNGGFHQQLLEGHEGVVILDKTNFYAEAGGQMSDSGMISMQDNTIMEVTQVINSSGYIAHHGTVTSGSARVGDTVKLEVNQEHRLSCMRNHTATHLLNAALHAVLSVVHQRSSFVGPTYMKFDYSSSLPLSQDNIQKVEYLVNTSIQGNSRVERSLMPIAGALQLPGIITLPGEVYPEMAHVIRIHSPNSESKFQSVEPCCGTHLHYTAVIEDFTIVSHKSVSHAVRSIKALTGKEARNARMMAERFKADINELQQKMLNISRDSINCDTIKTLHIIDKELRFQKQTIASGVVPLVARYTLEKDIETAQGLLMQLLKQHEKMEVSKKVQEDICRLIDNKRNIHFVVHFIKCDGDHKVIFSVATDVFSDVPSMFFTIDSGILYGQSYIPKGMVTEEFNAKTWGLEVSALFKIGGEKSVGKPSTKYLFKTKELEKIQEALKISSHIASNHFCRQ